ncbi:MAG: hypothetical protein M1825_005105 [Sarcosagium campestre]|nr:MAG: hypothetical protein M1825_005105 [Sarcosagium campestre]
MTTPKIFITGATGYIGGTALATIAKEHPEYQITALVRNSDKGAQVASRFPKIQLVYGDLDSVEVIEAAARNADIVLDTANADHVASADAIAAGLAAHPPSSPSFWIHTSGTGILCLADMERGSFGEAATKVYDDWEGIGEVTSLPDGAPHRNVDKIVLAAGATGAIRTAIVCPPTIYGEGNGPGNTRSIQLPDLAKGALQRKKGFFVGRGKSLWNHVHVADLAVVYLRLVEEAAREGGGDKASWGPEGYYFVENGEYAAVDLAKAVARAAHKQGLLESDEVESISADEAGKIRSYGQLLWGANSRSKAIRARKLLGWEPTEKSLFDTVDEVVTQEAKALGLIKGHAEKVTISHQT